MSELIAMEDLPEGGAVHLIQVEGRYCLQGSQCRSCTRSFFPVKIVCPYCGADAPVHVALPAHGSLYSFTTVHVSSSRKTPYLLGYVDLSPSIRVLSLLTGNAATLQLDAPVQLQVDAQGGWSFAAPAEVAHV